ncbi:cytochrome c oxidase accessory protein CcoG [Denitratisoma sp. DHT3]|uniref:cytochrome c oxidase accessory protein CcoG n=1 Tax=Denitratisoma sp. DHT3 TaxID=1981880 RepID=UPI0011984664|nr:cytochrome c oxidase accessory protein CcoG [Denitratisoma sp. DHT3]QDX80822.1 cytochrome c oxidase accessory protein CcoG [Denitratisoma sp. DHT3]
MSSPHPRPQADTAEETDGSLYEVHKKIYARSVTGVFASWRWVLVWLTQLVFYGLCWVPWNGRQAVLFDLVERKFYLFGLVLWPQDVFLLAILLIICAYALFLFTAVAGRLWCGYACPQTVYTEIFMWIEKLFEGDRNARMRLDRAPMNGAKAARKLGKGTVWVLLSLWTGFTLVGYFTPIKTLWSSFWSFDLGPWEAFWIFFYGGFTYLMAGHLREQVCKYMCPYARFQGVMFDPDTLVITYDAERGEPRGARSKKTDHRQQGFGDCVDCGLCVVVCPTGIDIRNGLQSECIGCAACIDACDQVMDKMGYPKGLIRYSTENALARHWGWKDILGHVVRPRVVIYSSVLAAICVAFVWGLATKPDLRVNVIRDRATLSREVEDGLIENVYRLQIMNVSEQPQRYSIAAEGLPGIQIVGERELDVAPASTTPMTIQVRVPPESGKRGANTIYINVASLSDPKAQAHEKAKFILP